MRSSVWDIRGTVRMFMKAPIERCRKVLWEYNEIDGSRRDIYLTGGTLWFPLDVVPRVEVLETAREVTPLWPHSFRFPLHSNIRAGLDVI